MKIIVGVQYRRNFLRQLVTCLIYLLLAISNSTAKREISLGKPFKLECEGKPSEVKWYKNDKLINPNQTSSRISIKSKGGKKSFVKVKNAETIDIGLYICYSVKNGKKTQIVAYNVSSVPSKYWVISVGF